MKLIIGGSSQGKLDYTLNLERLNIDDVFNGEDNNYYVNNKKIFNNFHLYIKKLLKEKKVEEIREIIEDILDNNKDIIIISDEIGNGIVPIEKFDRNYREVTGRILCYIAKRSKEVHRVYSGIGTLIKDDNK